MCVCVCTHTHTRTHTFRRGKYGPNNRLLLSLLFYNPLPIDGWLEMFFPMSMSRGLFLHKKFSYQGVISSIQINWRIWDIRAVHLNRSLLNWTSKNASARKLYTSIISFKGPLLMDSFSHLWAHLSHFLRNTRGQ